MVTWIALEFGLRKEQLGRAVGLGIASHIVLDLLCRVPVATPDGPVEMRIRGGLLGHWAVWTRRAVEVLDRCHAAVEGGPVDQELLTLAGAVTEMNAAVERVRLLQTNPATGEPYTARESLDIVQQRMSLANKRHQASLARRRTRVSEGVR